MKPTTKFHKDILKESRKLRPVTKAQAEWAIGECFEHFAFRIQSGKTTCMDCGHTWHSDETSGKCVCPRCGRKLTLETTRKQKVIYNKTPPSGGVVWWCHQNASL